MPLFLGLDSSTQSLSAMAIDLERGVVADESVNFGADLPGYASPSGFLLNAEPMVCHADPLMWVEAVDLLFTRLRDRGFDFADVKAIAGAGQQHGSVYLAKPIDEVGDWASDRPLVEQVRPLLSRTTSPIWMDASTTAECQEITRSMGRDDAVTRISGSRAIERFTGPQIRKFFKQDPAAYEKTREIQLVSSFVASLLSGKSAPIDLGDGAGMNLLELSTGTWNEDLLNATAPELGRRLRTPVASGTRVGSVAGYFSKRYGFGEDVPVFAFTGDNPSSLIGMGASEPGTAVVSLGTSDTVFAAMRSPHTDPSGYGHVFGNPAGAFMSLICFANGSLAREHAKNQYGLSWDDFSTLLAQTPPGNNENFMIPYFVPEMTPRILHPMVRRAGTKPFVAEKDAAAEVRAIVEAQAASMRLHSAWIGEKPSRILATGGAAKNAGILRIIADAFQAEILTLRVGNSSALGAALRAAHGATGKPLSELYSLFVAIDESSVVKPNPETAPVYDALVARLQRELMQLTRH